LLEAGEKGKESGVEKPLAVSPAFARETPVRPSKKPGKTWGRWSLGARPMFRGALLGGPEAGP